MGGIDDRAACLGISSQALYRRSLSLSPPSRPTCHTFIRRHDAASGRAMKQNQETLSSRIVDRSAAIGIVGMGYIGLPLMLAVTAKGFRVSGFDIDEAKVRGLNGGRSPLRHVP